MPQAVGAEVAAEILKATPQNTRRNNLINKPFPWKDWLWQNAIAIALMAALRSFDFPWPVIGAYFLLLFLPLNMLVIFHGARGHGAVLFTSESTPSRRILFHSYLITVGSAPFLVYYYHQGMPVERMILILVLTAVAWGVVFALRPYVRRDGAPGKTKKDLPDVM